MLCICTVQCTAALTTALTTADTNTPYRMQVSKLEQRLETAGRLKEEAETALADTAEHYERELLKLSETIQVQPHIISYHIISNKSMMYCDVMFAK
jgi:hypothetical protein